MNEYRLKGANKLVHQHAVWKHHFLTYLGKASGLSGDKLVETYWGNLHTSILYAAPIHIAWIVKRIHES